MEGVWMCHIVPAGLGFAALAAYIAVIIGVGYGIIRLGRIIPDCDLASRVGEAVVGSPFGRIALQVILGVIVVGVVGLLCYFVGLLCYFVGTAIAAKLWDCSNFTQ